MLPLTTSRRGRRLLALVVNARDLVATCEQQLFCTRDAVAAAVASGALDVLQLRTDSSDTKDVVDVAIQQLSTMLTHPSNSSAAATKINDGRAYRQPVLILNAPLDVLANRTNTLQSGVPGYHVKERDLFDTDLPHVIERMRAHHSISKSNSQQRETTTTPAAARAILGCSVHSVASAVHAAQLGFDYIQVGTMFATASHPEKTTLEGPALLQAILSASATSSQLDGVTLPPLVAVGGINSPQHAHQVLSAGANGVAVIRGILHAESGAASAAAAYRAALDKHSPQL